jgi:dTDP-3-amino-3,4,6-trideoxy-alpha-D-glucose transaminase
MIRMNDFQRQWSDTREAAVAAFLAVGESGWYILGRELREFEEALAGYWGISHVVGVASGLDAIEIALRVQGCKTGDRVLTTPLSAFATALAIVKIGAIPVFVDCDRFGLIDLDQVRARLKSGGGVRFIVPVHLYGHAIDLAALAAIAREFECIVVEDCAQSIGATFCGCVTGTVGRMSATSFYPTKNLGAMGDGGAILTNDDAAAANARMWRDYGQSTKYRHEVIGYNSRLDELQAALLRRTYLQRLPIWVQERRRVAAAYIAGISNPAITVMGVPSNSDSSCHLFPVLVEPSRKPDFMRWLQSHDVGCAEHYPILLPEQPAMTGVEFETVGDLDMARRICRSEVSLPVHPYLTHEEIAQVVDVCNAWRG